jgi:Flp pilus assembly pilin Flp
MRNLLSKLQRDEDGAIMAEYAITLGLITAAIIAALTLIGTDVGTILTNAQTALASVAA